MRGEKKIKEEVLTYLIPGVGGLACTELVLEGTESELVETLRKMGETKLKHIQSTLNSEMLQIGFALDGIKANMIRLSVDGQKHPIFEKSSEEMQNKYNEYCRTYEFIEKKIIDEYFSL